MKKRKMTFYFHDLDEIWSHMGVFLFLVSFSKPTRREDMKFTVRICTDVM